MIAREFKARMANGDDGPDDRMDLTVPYASILVANGSGWTNTSVRESTLYNGNMNILALSQHEQECAAMMCDRHLVRKFYEYLALLEAAAHYDPVRVSQHLSDAGMLRPGGVRCLSYIQALHPSYVWVTQNLANYQWLLEVTTAIHRELLIRFGPGSWDKRNHSREIDILQFVGKMPSHLPTTQTTATAPPQCLPWDYQVEHTVGNFNRWKNVIIAYRNWYCQEYYRFAKWTNREAPKWFTQSVSEMDLDALTTRREERIAQREREFIQAWNRIPESDDFHSQTLGSFS